MFFFFFFFFHYFINFQCCLLSSISLVHHRIGDGDITLVFVPGFQFAAGKIGRFLYVFDRAGSQPAAGRLQEIASGIDIVSPRRAKTIWYRAVSSEMTRLISCS